MTANIRVRFVTSWEKFRISDAPFAVPNTLGRVGLSEVVNHLLGSEEQQPFDFLIETQLLRTTLAKFLASRKISAEGIIVVEYMPAMTLADQSDSAELPAWVGSISTAIPNHIVTGCYDGQIRVMNEETLALGGSIVAHDTPIRSLAVVPNNESFQELFPTNSPYFPFDSRIGAVVFSGARDQSLKAWAFGSTSSELSHGLVANFSGHVNSIESLAVWSSAGQSSSILLSGDWSGNVFGWSLAGLLSAPSDELGADAEVSKKKSKSKSGKAQPVLQAKELKPTFTIRAHAQSVSAIATESSNTVSARAFTGSWDHSIKVWDIEQQDCVGTLAGSKVLTSLDYSNLSRLCASSHPDGKIRLWDPRSSDSAAACVQTVGSSSATHYVSQVRWSPSSQYVFASTDYNGAVKVWDTRASVPLGATEAHEGKALCVAWNQRSAEISGSRVVTGGSDCCVKCTALTY